MTSSEAQTGTDRVAEAAFQIDYDIYVNVQGDEPLVSPADIIACIKLKSANPDKVINGFTFMSMQEDPTSVNIPKVICNESGIMVYMSRTRLPATKVPENSPKRYMKQVCIYGFSKLELQTYSQFGRKSILENYEDIEILRFLEIGRPVLMYECQPGSLAVDVPSDVQLVEEALSLLTPNV
jgi:3-deoxy-manno-octulosonate cytidylyltransferase (CMP-KDO synthetase)